MKKTKTLKKRAGRQVKPKRVIDCSPEFWGQLTEALEPNERFFTTNGDLVLWTWNKQLIFKQQP